MIDSDATLVVNLGPMGGGALKTVQLAEKIAKPHLILQLDSGFGESETRQLQSWLRNNSIAVLNLGGPRESKRSGIYSLVSELLQRALDNYYYPMSEETIHIKDPLGIGSYTSPATYLYVMRKPTP